jgi:hypothetical protein
MKEAFEKTFTKKTMGRKGQTEIIGLAIVVILLIFALIFFVQVRSNDENETRLIQYNLRANSALNALMKVHVEEEQMKDLVEKCFKDPVEGSNCNIVEQRVNYFLNQINNDGERGMFPKGDYYLALYEWRNDIPKISFGVECERGISASPFVVRNSGSVKFEVCS